MYCDPRSPMRAMLEPGKTWQSYTSVLMAAVLLGGGLAVLLTKLMGAW